MKFRFFILAIFLFVACPARAAISFVSGSSTNCVQATASTSTLACTLSGTTTLNNTVFVFIGINVTTSTVSSVTDSGGSAYTRCGGCYINNSTSVREELWTTAAGSAKASTTVTVTLTAGSKFNFNVEEYSGVAAIGVVKTATASAANPSINDLTVDTNNFKVAGFAGQGTGTFTSSVGNLRANGTTTGGSAGTNVGNAACDGTATTAGSTVTCTVTNADTVWAMIMVELRTFSGGNAVVTSCTPAAAASCTLSATPAFGNLLISFAYRGNSATNPTTPAGWTNINSTTGNTNSLRTAWKFALGNETTCGTWTNATQTYCEVYSGNWIASAGPIGTAISGTTGSSTTVSYPTFTLNNPLRTSWVVCAGGATSATSGMAAAPIGMTLRSGTSIASIAYSDTNGSVNAWPATTVTIAPTSVWATACFEIIGTPAVSSISGNLVSQVYTTQSGQACTGVCNFTVPIPTNGGSKANNELNLFVAWTYVTTAPTVSNIFCNNDTGHATWTWTAVQTLTDTGDTTDVTDYHIDGAAGGCTSVTVVFNAVFSAVLAHYTEWRQIATSSAVDTSAGQTSTTPPFFSSGSFTPTTSGDVIYHYCTPVNFGLFGFGNNPTYGAGGSTFLGVDNTFQMGGEAFVQSSALAISPFQNAVSQAGNGICVGIAFKTSTGAGTNPTGVQIINQAQNVDGSQATTNIQATVLNSGDTLIVFGTAGNVPGTTQACTGISDSLGHSWSIKQQAGGANAAPMLSFDSNSKAGNDYITLTGCATGGNQNWTVVELAGTNNSSHTSSFDATMGECIATGAGTPYSSAPGSCAPSTSNGVMLAMIEIGTGPFTGSSSPTGGTYNFPVYTGMTDTSFMTEGGGYSNFYNTGTSAQSWTWTGNPNTAAWGASAFAFEAPPVASCTNLIALMGLGCR